MTFLLWQAPHWLDTLLSESADVGVKAKLTYLMEELWELHLYLLSLEHVVLCLLADGRDQVELPCHRVRLLQDRQEYHSQLMSK